MLSSIILLGITYMGETLSTWHIDRAWRVNIRSMIRDNKKQIAVYHQLCTLLEESFIVRFREMLQQSISWMLSDPHLGRFCQYFQMWYCKRIEVWAYCYRIGTLVNTNMSIESFHRLLKVVYLEGKHITAELITSYLLSLG